MNTSQDVGTGTGMPAGSGAGGGPGGIGSLISGTIKDLQELVRAEVQLAKTELKEDAAAAGRAVAVIAAGAVVAEGFEGPPGALMVGVPAAMKRILDEPRQGKMARNAQTYIDNAMRFRREMRVVSGGM